MKTKLRLLCMLVFVSITALCFCMGACSARGESTDRTDGTIDTATIDIENAIATAQATDPYIADEVCLSCHGGTYEGIAASTDHLGDSNPHAGTHGAGGLSCDNCHTDGQTAPTEEDNLCSDCHAWPRDIESYIAYMDL